MKCLMKTLAVSLFVAGTITVSADNLLKNTTFSAENGWSFWVSKSVSDAGGSGTLVDAMAVAKSPAAEKQDDSNIQLIRIIDVDVDKSYKVKFKANAEKAGSLTVCYILSKNPYNDYAWRVMALEAGEKEYECTLAVKKDKNGN